MSIMKNITYEMDNVKNKWKLWCRLCAKDDEQNINIYSECVQPSHSSKINFIAAINEYFHVQITQEEDLPQAVCTQCLLMITSLIEFAARVEKVQEMYNDLKDRNEGANLNLPLLSQEYGVLHEDAPVMHTLTETNKFHTTSRPEKNTCDLPSFICTESSIAKNEIICKEESDVLTQEFDTIYQFKDPLDQDGEIQGCESPSSTCTIEAYSNGKTEENVVDNNKSNDPEKVRGTNSDVCEKGLASWKKRLNKRKSNNEKCQEKVSDSNSDVSEKHLASSKKSLNKGKYLCSYCPQRFQRISNYTIHIKKKHGHTENAAYACPNCDLMFSRGALMAQHIKSVHSDENAFICEECGKILGSKTTLREHVLTHASYAPFECKVCGRRFKQKARLKVHMDIHGAKYICKECGLQLSSRATLHCHLLVHSDAMPHKCDYCGRAFKRSQTLKKHLILHTGLKPYSCDFCELTFTNGTCCRQHKKKIHPKELAAQEASGEKPHKIKTIPKLDVLKAITRTAKDLRPVASKQSGNFSFGKKRNLEKSSELPSNYAGSNKASIISNVTNDMDVPTTVGSTLPRRPGFKSDQGL